MPRARIGSCCGGGPSNPGGGRDLDSITDIRKFISLIDSNATVKDYQREFGWSRDRLNSRLAEHRLYRRTMMCADKIKKIIESCNGPDDIELSRPEITRLRKLMWKDGPLDEV